MTKYVHTKNCFIPKNNFVNENNLFIRNTALIVSIIQLELSVMPDKFKSYNFSNIESRIKPQFLDNIFFWLI